MLVAEIVVETLPGKAQAVVECLGRIHGMGRPQPEGDHRVKALWTIPDNDTLEGISEVLRAMSPDIVEVYPTFLGRADSPPEDT